MSETKIRFTVINLGNVATPEVQANIAEGRFHQQTPIHVADLISAVDWLLSVSEVTEVGDINLIQKHG